MKYLTTWLNKIKKSCRKKIIKINKVKVILVKKKHKILKNNIKEV